MLLKQEHVNLIKYFILFPTLLAVNIYYLGVYYLENLRFLTLSIMISFIGSYGAYLKRSLTLDGVLYAMLVGSMIAFANCAFFICLYTFFVTSSILTKYKHTQKQKQSIDEEQQKGGRRNCWQVLCNGVVPAFFSAIYILSGGQGLVSELTGISYSRIPAQITIDQFSIIYSGYISLDNLAILGVLVSLCVANGDTWASEVGSVRGGTPILITNPFRKVPVGTNGGVTLVGTVASFVGGIAIGLAYYTSQIITGILYSVPNMFPGIAITRLLGFFTFLGLTGAAGSFVDSILGALFQYSGIDRKSGKVSQIKIDCVSDISGLNILNNNMVNLLSILFVTVTTLAILIIGMPLWPLTPT